MNWLKDEKCEKYCVASRSLPPTSLALAIIRSHYEPEERSLRTPLRPGRSRGPRHAGGSLAGHRHRAGYFVLVRADGVRGARRQARRGEVELRPGHGVPFRRDGLGSAAEICRGKQRLGPEFAAP